MFFCTLLPYYIVGYQGLTLKGNTSYNWVLSTFQQIGNSLENQTVGAFQIPTDEMFMGGDSLFMEIYGTDGKLAAKYTFVDESNVGNYGLTVPGWYPFDPISNWDTVTDDDCVNDEIIPMGKGVVITSGEADTTLTFAGQVYGEEQTYTLYGNTSYNWVGNSTPVDLYLKDFAIPTDQNFMSGDSLFMEIYGTDGKLAAKYTFVDESNVGNYGLTVPGWYPFDPISNWDTVTDDDCVNNTAMVKSGQMVIITNGEADTTLTLPKVL